MLSISPSFLNGIVSGCFSHSFLFCEIVFLLSSASSLIFKNISVISWIISLYVTWWFFLLLSYFVTNFRLLTVEYDIPQPELICIYSAWYSSCIWNIHSTIFEELWPLFSDFFSIFIDFPCVIPITDMPYHLIPSDILLIFLSIFMYSLHLGLCLLIYVQFTLFTKSIQGIYFTEISTSDSRICLILCYCFYPLLQIPSLLRFHTLKIYAVLLEWR